ncbi:MAG: AsmA-like C-terminal region-containing protein [Flavipsychrobacter sp.]|nr:AsmA-like C-terminal region-containing protein [Flavipsychrobacter sp.]
MKIGKLFKRLLLFVGVLVGLLVLTAILVPVLFKDKILATLKTQMNTNLDAVTDFKDIDISLFHHFPNLSVGIMDISIKGKGYYKDDTLIAAKDIEVTVDIMQAIHGVYDILSVDLNTPRIHALVNDKGQANWNITKPDTTTKAATPAQSSSFAFKLRKYSIENGYIEYKDDQGKMSAIIDNLNHNGSGDFTSDAFTLSTHTTIDALSFAYGNIPYLAKVKTLVDMDLQVDNKNNKYTFNTDKIQLNGLKLATKGFVQLPDTINTLMDIQFSTPSNNFKDILSLIPGIYQADFKNIQTSGTVALSGFAKGTYNSKQMPAFQVNLAIQNGMFRYPSLPSAVTDIQVKMQAANNDGVPDHTVVNVEKAHLVLANAPFDMHLILKTPISDPYIDAGLKGRIDLGQVQQFMKLEAGTKLTGIVTADVTAKGAIAAAQKQQFDKFYAAGTIGISNMLYASKDYPGGVALSNLLLTFNPKNVSVSGLKAQYLQSNFTGDGTINNLLGYYFHKEALSGTFTVAADKVDVNKFMGTSSTAQPATSTTPPSATTTPFLVPDNLDITLNATVGTVLYDKLTLTNVKGTLLVKDQTVTMKDISGNGLDGTMVINGSYSTKNDKKNPDITMAYKVQNVDIQKTYNAFITVQKMMPAGKYISGKISSQLTMQGKMGQDMTPVINSLTGKGDLLIINGVLSGFPAMQQLGDKLNISQLKSFPLQDIKNFFTFVNGRVIVDPYKFKEGDIDFEVAGSHGFDQTIKYGLNLTVPRSMMGSAGNTMINNLVNQAAGKGVAINVGDKVNLAITIGGTITVPKIETNLKSLAGDAVNNVKQQITNEIKSKTDSVKRVVKDTVNAIKKQALNAAAEELKNQISGNKDTTHKNTLDDTKKKAQDAVKGLKGLFGK